MKTIKIDAGEIKSDKQRNFIERIWFIKYWANYIRNNSDENLSKGQAILIDSLIQSSKNFYKSLEKTEEGRQTLLRLKKNMIEK